MPRLSDWLEDSNDTPNWLLRQDRNVANGTAVDCRIAAAVGHQMLRHRRVLHRAIERVHSSRPVPTRQACCTCENTVDCVALQSAGIGKLDRRFVELRKS